MDIDVHKALTVLLSLLKDARLVQRFQLQLVKLYYKLVHLHATDLQFRRAYESYVRERAGK